MWKWDGEELVDQFAGGVFEGDRPDASIGTRVMGACDSISLLPAVSLLAGSSRHILICRTHHTLRGGGDRGRRFDPSMTQIARGQRN